MVSDKQLEANRQNAELSTGPKTEEGKRRSSLNARRHGLTGQVTAMTEEDRAAHDRFSAAMIKDLAPEGALETQLAQRIATDSWRLNRISAVEDNLFALGFHERAGEVDTDHPEAHAALVAAKVFAAESKTIDRLALYEQRLNRAVHKNLAALEQLQAKRKADRRAAMEQAEKLYQVDGWKEEHSAQPSQIPAESAHYQINGFVFSNAEIRAAVDLRRRLERAEQLNSRHEKHGKQPVRAEAA